MKKIPLTQNKETIVDDEDYEYLNQWKWCYNNGYVVRQSSRKLGKRKRFYIHRVIINCPENMEVDHINNNKLDNRRSNLRICSSKENSRNRSKRQKTSSKYKGVSWKKADKKWQVSIMVNNKYIYLGLFKTEEEAAKAYNDAAIKYFYEFAKLNNAD